jgi:hypothetical protein
MPVLWDRRFLLSSFLLYLLNKMSWKYLLASEHKSIPTHIPDYTIFKSFMIWNLLDQVTLNLFSFKTVFTFISHLFFHLNFRLSWSRQIKNLVESFVGSQWIYCFWNSWWLYCITSSHSWKCYIFHLLTSFHHLQQIFIIFYILLHIYF